MSSQEAVVPARSVVERVISPPPLPSRAERPRSEHVKVCQVGYLRDETKFALLTAPPQGRAQVRRSSDDVAVLEVVAGSPGLDVDSGDVVRAVDFSDLTEPGTYYLDVGGVGTSDEFRISAEAFVRPFRLAMRMFAGQRCGCGVDLSPDFSDYRHPPCHRSKATFHISSGRHGYTPCTGGWHDAGDYGRYVVNAGITIATLLWTWELNAPKLRAIPLNVPEAGGDVPDLLAEVRWGLRW